MRRRLVCLVVLTLLPAGLAHSRVLPTGSTAPESCDTPGQFLVRTTPAGVIRMAQGGDGTPGGLANTDPFWYSATVPAAGVPGVF
ncbi:MAG: hypothetical protein KBE04_07980 [Phycisphaerae bacterium]|nr:hypothetical protein [Phycisphaerae bacterium]